MRLIFGAVIGLALAGCSEGERSLVQAASAWAAASAVPLAPPVDCVERSGISGQVARDDRTLDVTMTDGRLLRNRLPYACEGLGRQSRLLYRTASERVCSTDTIVMIQSDGRPGASCGLGRFQQIAVPTAPVPLR
jgi:hypothetical protein